MKIKNMLRREMKRLCRRRECWVPSIDFLCGVERERGRGERENGECGEGNLKGRI